MLACNKISVKNVDKAFKIEIIFVFPVLITEFFVYLDFKCRQSFVGSHILRETENKAGFH